MLVIDTPGIDDAGDVGDLRVQRAEAALNEADVAVLVMDATRGMTSFDERGSSLPSRRAASPTSSPKTRPTCLRKAGVLAPQSRRCLRRPWGRRFEWQSPLGRRRLQRRGLRRKRRRFRTGRPRARVGADGGGAGRPEAHPRHPGRRHGGERRLVGDLLEPGDVVVLVIPLDSAAPKGRIILPQQQVMRDALEAGAFPCATGVEGLPDLLAALARPPRLVVTDSQVFAEVDALLPAEVPLTSFSILMARYKGDLPAQLEAVRALESLTDNDTVLIAEGCTHHRTCEDIGTVKLPRLIRAISGTDPRFAFTSGRDFPDDLSPYAAIVHCGGCTLNARDMASRIQRARAQQIPLTNYGHDHRPRPQHPPPRPRPLGRIGCPRVPVASGVRDDSRRSRPAGRMGWNSQQSFPAGETFSFRFGVVKLPRKMLQGKRWCEFWKMCFFARRFVAGGRNVPKKHIFQN
ncbi:MAG: [FeFe] hydrogenase H-cluster maturation GTPase HydF [Adlercreutzia equolifaciens]